MDRNAELYKEHLLKHLQDMASDIFDIQSKSSTVESAVKTFSLHYPCSKYTLVLDIRITPPLDRSSHPCPTIKQEKSDYNEDFISITQNLKLNSFNASTSGGMNAHARNFGDIHRAITVQSLVNVLSNKGPMNVKRICASYRFNFIPTSKMVNELLGLFHGKIFHVDLSTSLWSLTDSYSHPLESPFSDMLIELKKLLKNGNALDFDKITFAILSRYNSGWKKKDLKRVLTQFQGVHFDFDFESEKWSLLPTQ